MVVAKLAAMRSSSAAEQSPKGADLCVSCKQKVQTYFRVGSGLCCSACIPNLREALRTNPSRYYWKAAGAGIVASAVCGVIYGSLLVAARTSFGSFFIGVIIATVMRISSNDSGSLRYRLTAVVLTYLAGSLPWGFLFYDKGVAF